MNCEKAQFSTSTYEASKMYQKKDSPNPEINNQPELHTNKEKCDSLKLICITKDLIQNEIRDSYCSDLSYEENKRQRSDNLQDHQHQTRAESLKPLQDSSSSILQSQEIKIPQSNSTGVKVDKNKGDETMATVKSESRLTDFNPQSESETDREISEEHNEQFTFQITPDNTTKDILEISFEKIDKQDDRKNTKLSFEKKKGDENHTENNYEADIDRMLFPKKSEVVIVNIGDTATAIGQPAFSIRKGSNFFLYMIGFIFLLTFLCCVTGAATFVTK